MRLDRPEIADTLALKRRGWTLALLTLTYFFSFMDRQILAILLEAIKADLRLSDTQLGLLSGLVFAIFYATLGIPIARLADRTSRKRIIAISLAVWSAMTALSGFAQNFTQLMLARIGVDRLEILGESEPGVVISQTTGEARPRFVATKAGAFGDAASLDRARLDIKSRIAASHGGGPAIRMFFHTDTTTP